MSMHAFCHALSVETTGIGFRQFLKRCVGLNPKPQAYKDYRSIVKAHQKAMNASNPCAKIDIVRTYEETAQAHGFHEETLETLHTTEFMEAFYQMMKKKGYKIPKTLEFMEYRLPRGSGLAGETLPNLAIYNPTSCRTLDFRVPIHEEGHHLNPVGFFTMTGDMMLQDIGALLKKLRLCPKDRTICHLTQKEQEILKADLRRAYQEGFFTHNPTLESRRQILSTAKTPEEKAKIAKRLNKTMKEFRKHPEDFYLPNMLVNRAEFMADYFHLTARGFNFSPEIVQRFEKYGGKAAQEIITPEDLEELENLRKAICKKTLADYGYQMAKA